MNFKSVTFASFLLFLFAPSSVMNAAGVDLLEAVKKACAAGKATLSQSEKLKQLAEVARRASSTAVAQNSTQALKTAMAAKGLAVVKSAAETSVASVAQNVPARTFKDTCSNLFSALGNASGATQLANNIADAARLTRSYIAPTEDEKLQKENAALQLRIFRARVALNAALVTHARAEKDRNGIPLPCKPQADEYAKCAGLEALKQFIEAHNRTGIQL
jgi:hypothetical protein